MSVNSHLCSCSKAHSRSLWWWSAHVKSSSTSTTLFSCIWRPGGNVHTAHGTASLHSALNPADASLPSTLTPHPPTESAIIACRGRICLQPHQHFCSDCTSAPAPLPCELCCVLKSNVQINHSTPQFYLLYFLLGSTKCPMGKLWSCQTF